MKAKPSITRIVVALLAIGLIAFATYEAVHTYRHVYEPNARVEAEITVLSSSVNGIIAAIHVQIGDLVESGTKLASMDSDVAALDVQSLQADLEKERALARQVESELATFQSELDEQITTEQARVELLGRELESLRERQRIAAASVERNRKLLDRSAISRDRIDATEDRLLDITSKLRDLETKRTTRSRLIEELRGRRQREGVYRSRLAVIERNMDKLQVLLDQSVQRLTEMDIYAPERGVVNEIYVTAGAYLEDGDPVFLLHHPDRVWIEADIDESDIRHVEVGQTVVVELDAYPFEEYRGTVRSIGKVTRSTIAMARKGGNGERNTNPVQRIPILIDFPPIGKSVWPGMRAAVNIVIR